MDGVEVPKLLLAMDGVKGVVDTMHWMGFAHLAATMINLRIAESGHRP